MAQSLEEASSLLKKKSLEEAAETGDINGLYDLIKEDPNVLDGTDAIPFVHTPLHIATSAGHTDFAIEILRLKPSFGRKLNPKGESSLHLALINKKFDTVKRLIKFDKEIIRVKGREGFTPLHFIAQKDINGDQQRMDDFINAEQQQREEDPSLNILAEFLFACPDSVEDLTIRDETALHIAEKSKNEKAVEVIKGCIHKIDRKRVLDYKDKEGNTALHMAVSTSQDEDVDVIVSSLRRARATWPKEIVRSLCYAGALECSLPDPSLAEFLSSPEQLLDVLFKHKIRMRRIMSELRNNVLVVAVLIATATFNAILGPPGGVGGPGNNNLLTNGSGINATVSSTNHLFAAANTSFINATFFIPTTDDPVKRFIFKVGHGQATYGDFFGVFYVCNTMAFVFSMLMIMFVIPLKPFLLLHGALVSFMMSYGISFYVISPSNGISEAFQIVSIVCALLLYLCRGVIGILTSKAGSKRIQMLKCLLNNVEK